MKIAIYSGSFNPIHLGHTQLAEYLIDNNLVDEVWFIISPLNPLKSPASQLDEQLRLEMVNLAIEEQAAFKVSDIEFSMPIPSYTIDTLSKLSTQYPEHQFILIIGSDNAVVFDQWKAYEDILMHYPVMVYPRRNYDLEYVAKKFPEMELLESPYFDISSTQIREIIKNKQDASEWLHKDVLQFIQTHKLYL